MKILLWFFVLLRFHQFNWIGPAIAAGGALLGGAMSNKANAKESAIDREYQRENAQHAHQWEVDDLRAAGLNPILSATGGAGARASGGATIPGQQDVVGPAVTSALAARRQSEELKLMHEQTQKTIADKDLANEQKQTELDKQLNFYEDSLLKRQQQNATWASANNTSMDTVLKDNMVTTEKERAAAVRAQAAASAAQAALTSHSARSAQVEADMDTHAYGKKLKWANRTTEAAEGASSAVRSFINPFHGASRRRGR